MGFIYRIYNEEHSYYGSSRTNIKNVLGRHSYHYKSYLNGGHNYVYSFKIIQTGNYNIELVEDNIIDNQLKIRENYYILNFDCVNKYKSYLSQEEKKERDKKDLINFYINHPEKKEEYSKKRSEKCLCSCGKEISKRNINRHLKNH